MSDSPLIPINPFSDGITNEPLDLDQYLNKWFGHLPDNYRAELKSRFINRYSGRDQHPGRLHRIWDEIKEEEFEASKKEWAASQPKDWDRERESRFQPPPEADVDLDYEFPQPSGLDVTSDAYEIECLAERVAFLERLVKGLHKWNSSLATSLEKALLNVERMVEMQSPKQRQAERDKWVYEQYHNTHWNNIIERLKEVAEERGWAKFTARKSVYDCVRRHQRNNPDVPKLLEDE